MSDDEEIDFIVPISPASDPGVRPAEAPVFDLIDFDAEPEVVETPQAEAEVLADPWDETDPPWCTCTRKAQDGWSRNPWTGLWEHPRCGKPTRSEVERCGLPA